MELRLLLVMVVVVVCDERRRAGRCSRRADRARRHTTRALLLLALPPPASASEQQQVQQDLPHSGRSRRGLRHGRMPIVVETPRLIVHAVAHARLSVKERPRRRAGSIPPLGGVPIVGLGASEGRCVQALMLGHAVVSIIPRRRCRVHRRVHHGRQGRISIRRRAAVLHLTALLPPISVIVNVVNVVVAQRRIGYGHRIFLLVGGPPGSPAIVRFGPGDDAVAARVPRSRRGTEGHLPVLVLGPEPPIRVR